MGQRGFVAPIFYINKEMKKYIAKTNVSINVVLSSGANRHIAFSSVSGGGSVFYTDDPEIQKAIESHYKFGKLFRIDKEASVTVGPKAVAKKTGVEVDDADATASGVEENGLKKVVVSDPDSAKSYLAEHFGISRTKLKSLKSIKETAELNGIVFEGI